MLSTRIVEGADAKLIVDEAELSVTRGPDRGTKLLLCGDSILIGSAPTCELVLHDGTVSGRHAEIQCTSRGYVIRDLGSTNGIVIAGIAVERAPLGDGMKIVLGESTITVRASGKQNALALHSAGRVGELVVLSVKMRAFASQLEQVAKSDATVLLEGETGSGKEVAAETLHALSARKGSPFVVFDCGAVTGTLAGAELFGVEAGAFTGAEVARAGLFEEAEGGTLFLDEIGELPLELQPLLLGALERKRSRRVGGKTDRAHHVRIVAATHRNLAEEVRAGRFRQDLYYRLAAVRLRVPPLRERAEDIAVLAEAFARELQISLSPEALAPLAAYEWPGNVRELRNTIQRFAAQPGKLELSRAEAPRAQSIAFDERGKLRTWFEARRLAGEAAEREYFSSLLEETGGHLTRAAELAGIARQSLSAIVNRHGLRKKTPGA